VKYDYIDRLYFITITPPIVSLLIYVISKLHEQKYRGKKNILSVKAKLQRYRSYYFTAFLFYTYLILPSLSVSILNIFVCKNVDPDNSIEGDDTYLMADYSISCSSDRYKSAFIYSIFMLLLYPVSVPLLYFYLLFTTREDIKQRLIPLKDEEAKGSRQRRLLPLRVLYNSYKCYYWYWEIVFTLFRLSMSALLVVIGQVVYKQDNFIISYYYYY
jgi:hypothetical protein